MKMLPLFIASIALVSLTATAQTKTSDAGPPGPGWKAIVPGRPVFITTDSVTKIGAESFRYMIFRRLGDAESTETAEVRCVDRTRRTVRLETRGKFIVPDKSGKHRKVQETPTASFENPYPGGAADVILQRVCDMGHAKFPSAKRR
jgi:hypothetical protein